MSRVTPGTITFAIAFYAAADPEDYVGKNHSGSRFGTDTVAWFQEEGLIDEHHQPTMRLAAWIKHLCEQPLPEQQWIVPPQGHGEMKE